MIQWLFTQGCPWRLAFSSLPRPCAACLIAPFVCPLKNNRLFGVENHTLLSQQVVYLLIGEVVCLVVFSSPFLNTPTTPPPFICTGMGGGYIHSNHFVRLSARSSVRVSDRVCSISPEPINQVCFGCVCVLVFFLIRLGTVVYYHEAMCHAEKMVHYLECQGHSEGLNKQNITISTISSRLLFHLQPYLV